MSDSGFGDTGVGAGQDGEGGVTGDMFGNFGPGGAGAGSTLSSRGYSVSDIGTGAFSGGGGGGGGGQSQSAGSVDQSLTSFFAEIDAFEAALNAGFDIDTSKETVVATRDAQGNIQPGGFAIVGKDFGEQTLSQQPGQNVFQQNLVNALSIGAGLVNPGLGLATNIAGNLITKGEEGIPGAFSSIFGRGVDTAAPGFGTLAGAFAERAINEVFDPDLMALESPQTFTPEGFLTIADPTGQSSIEQSKNLLRRVV